MKTYLFLLAATILCMSCSWESGKTPEIKKVYIQTHSEEQQNTASNDSVLVVPSGGAQNSPQETVVSDSSRQTPLQCDLSIEGKLIVDGGSSTDISDTYVTVEKVIVNVWVDNEETKIYSPKIHTEVAEPSKIFGWAAMPTGINYVSRELVETPISISYMYYFTAEITVYFILRVKDSNLAQGYTQSRYRVTSMCYSNNVKDNSLNVLVPLELTTVKFDAAVDGYE